MWSFSFCLPFFCFILSGIVWPAKYIFQFLRLKLFLIFRNRRFHSLELLCTVPQTNGNWSNCTMCTVHNLICLLHEADIWNRNDGVLKSMRRDDIASYSVRRHYNIMCLLECFFSTLSILICIAPKKRRRNFRQQNVEKCLLQAVDLSY